MQIVYLCSSMYSMFITINRTEFWFYSFLCIGHQLLGSVYSTPEPNKISFDSRTELTSLRTTSLCLFLFTLSSLPWCGRHKIEVFISKCSKTEDIKLSIRQVRAVRNGSMLVDIPSLECNPVICPVVNFT